MLRRSRLLRRYLQPFLSPYPLHPLMVYIPTTISQQSGDPPVAVPAESTCQLQDLLAEHPFIFHGLGLIALCGPGMVQRPAGSSLRHSEGLPHVVGKRGGDSPCRRVILRHRSKELPKGPTADLILDPRRPSL